MSGHPKFGGFHETKSGGLLAYWEDASVARWVPSEPIIEGSGANRVAVGFSEAKWVAIPSPDYETLFCTTTKTYHERATDSLNLELAPDVGVDD